MLKRRKSYVSLQCCGTAPIREATNIYGGNKVSLEKMSDFFTARMDGYDEHMLGGDWGYKEALAKLVKYVPSGTAHLLDLGCGSGLELDKIFKLYPDIAVTGVDLTQSMLDRLTAKYPDKSIKLICDSYFDVDFGNDVFDTAISCETLHHFSHGEKQELYERVLKSLAPNGRYIECDYMVTEQSEEDFCFAENERIRKEQGIAEGEFYHYDTPCTVANQIKLLLCAGFKSARMVFRKHNTTIIVADKKELCE